VARAGDTAGRRGSRGLSWAMGAVCVGTWMTGAAVVTALRWRHGLPGFEVLDQAWAVGCGFAAVHLLAVGGAKAGQRGAGGSIWAFNGAWWSLLLVAGVVRRFGLGSALAGGWAAWTGWIVAASLAASASVSRRDRLGRLTAVVAWPLALLFYSSTVFVASPWWLGGAKPRLEVVVLDGRAKQAHVTRWRDVVWLWSAEGEVFEYGPPGPEVTLDTFDRVRDGDEPRRRSPTTAPSRAPLSVSTSHGSPPAAATERGIQSTKGVTR